jgi:hypothetical protein
MDPVPKLLAISSLFLCLLSLPLPEASAQDGPIRLNDKGYFETRGFNVLAFENAYTGFFFDEKTSGVMLIQHGVLVIPPDFPENKNDWPFFWGENEYVIDINAEYLYLVHAVHALGRADR